jgi:hypothetical protein
MTEFEMQNYITATQTNRYQLITKQEHHLAGRIPDPI